MERKEFAVGPSKGTAKLERVMSMQWILFGVICAVFYGFVALDYSSDPETCVATDQF